MRFTADKNFWRLWLAIIGTACIVLLAAFTMVQQSTRLAAYDSPLALNQSIVNRLDNGAAAANAVPATNGSFHDLIPFAILTDSSMQVTATSTTGNSMSVLPPAGSFAYAKAHGQNRFTWQPAPGVRLATIITSYKNGSQYIVTGQSLSEAESRIEVYSALMVLAGFGVIIWSSLVLGWHRR